MQCIFAFFDYLLKKRIQINSTASKSQNDFAPRINTLLIEGMGVLEGKCYFWCKKLHLAIAFTLSKYHGQVGGN